MSDMICNCEPVDWDPKMWVFSHLHRGGWFCMKCQTDLGYFRDEFTGEEEWRPKPAPVPPATQPKPKAKRGVLRRLLGVIS